ncbi:MAG: hypothetical protein K2N83_03925 [Eubacterium sp.]|nr:hypothetical protein [Eubacterium sp.]
MRIPIIIPTSRASFKPWIKIVGVILIAVGIWVTVSNVDFKEVELVPECTVAFSDMNKTDVYETTDMIVFDSFATIKTDYSETDYFLVGIWEDDETLKYATLVTDKSDGWLYTELQDYYNDSSLWVGDCRIPMFYTVTKLSSLDKELQDWYYERIDDYAEYDYHYESTGLVLHYACDTLDDFAQYKQEAVKNNKTNIILAAAFILGGLLCEAVGFILSNNDKKKAQVYAQNNAEYYNPGQTGTYYQPEAFNQSAQAESAPQEYASAVTPFSSCEEKIPNDSDNKTEG